MTRHHLFIACGVLVVAAAVGGGVLSRRIPAPPKVAAVEAPEWVRKLTQEADEPPPRFSTPEQARAYYDAVIAGETRTLDLLNAAIRGADQAADPDYRALLQGLQQRYERRLQTHRALSQ